MPAANEPPVNATESRSRAATLMPRSVRRFVLFVLAGLVASALGIAAVRGPAMLIDLAAAAGRWLCL